MIYFDLVLMGFLFICYFRVINKETDSTKMFICFCSLVAAICLISVIGKLETIIRLLGS
jgi:hypothetical protein